MRSPLLNRPDPRPANFVRTNFQIRVSSVRVVQDGQPLGVMPTEQARKLATDAGMDLVELVPQAKPPVCHILDYAHYKYEQKQKEKDQRRKQREATVELKEIRLRPNIGPHDIEVKVAAARRFLEEGKRVQLNLQFKNREIAHKDEGYRVIDAIVQGLTDVADVDRPKQEGFKLVCVLEPKK